MNNTNIWSNANTWNTNNNQFNNNKNCWSPAGNNFKNQSQFGQQNQFGGMFGNTMNNNNSWCTSSGPTSMPSSVNNQKHCFQTNLNTSQLSCTSSGSDVWGDIIDSVILDEIKSMGGSNNRRCSIR